MNLIDIAIDFTKLPLKIKRAATRIGLFISEMGFNFTILFILRGVFAFICTYER